MTIRETVIYENVVTFLIGQRESSLLTEIFDIERLLSDDKRARYLGGYSYLLTTKQDFVIYGDVLILVFERLEMRSCSTSHYK